MADKRTENIPFAAESAESDAAAADSVREAMERKLRAAFKPDFLEIINESGKHKGHSSHKGAVPEETGETHFRVKIISADFAAQTQRERHRAVYHILAHELSHGVHALTLEAKAPHERSR